MQVVAFASQKGGSGKTTLAGHIAVQAERAGFGPVALVDTDPQGSLADWWNEREAEVPLFAHTSIARLSEDLARMRGMGINLVVIDTPPAITATIAEVIRLCDLVVVPTRPSPHDLRAVGVTVELVERLGKPLVFVVNAASPRARITSEAVIAGGVSMTTRLIPMPRMRARSSDRRAMEVCANSGVSASRSFHQSAKLPWGSVSTSATGPKPARSACTAICPASVVLPEPPFCEANAITCI